MEIESDDEDLNILCKDHPDTHKFHHKCLDNWVQTNFDTHHKLADCPICRGNLKIKESVWDIYKIDAKNSINTNNNEIKYWNKILSIQQLSTCQLKYKHKKLSKTPGNNLEELLEINNQHYNSIYKEHKYINLCMKLEKTSQNLLYKLFIIDYLYNQTMVSNDIENMRPRFSRLSYEARAREMHIV